MFAISRCANRIPKQRFNCQALCRIVSESQKNCSNSRFAQTWVAIEPQQSNDSSRKLINELDPTDVHYERYVQIKQWRKQQRKLRNEEKRQQRTEQYYRRLAVKHDLQLADGPIDAESMKRLAEQCERVKTGIHYDATGQPGYGLWKNSMFVHRRRSDIRVGRSYRLMQAYLNGPKLVFDFSYDQYMNIGELRNLGLQIAYCVGMVQADESADPFAVYFSNLAADSLSERVLCKAIGNLNKPTSLISVHRTSLLQHLPKQNTIYLSPHADQCLNEFEPGATYVIGGFIDQSFPKPLSHLKAAEAGVRCYRLPIDEHINWKLGCKYLPLPQVTGILIDVKNQTTWKRALSDNIRKMYQEQNG